MPSFTLGYIKSAHLCFPHPLDTSPLLPSPPMLHSCSPSHSPSFHILFLWVSCIPMMSNLPLQKLSTNDLLFPKTPWPFTMIIIIMIVLIMIVIIIIIMIIVNDSINNHNHNIFSGAKGTVCHSCCSSY